MSWYSWNAASSGMNACLWKQSHVGWDARSCLFFPGLFFQAKALWHAGFSLIPEIPRWGFVGFFKQTNNQRQKGPVAVTSGSCTKEFCLINVVLYSLFFLPGAISQRWLTRCRASFILEIFVLSMQRAQQMDLLALWGKSSCSLVLKTP